MTRFFSEVHMRVIEQTASQSSRAIQRESPAKASVLFIAGWGRSGSTLLDTLLGSLPGMVSVGEVAHLWSRGLLENRRCGCGSPVGSCELWTAVTQRLLAAGLDPAQLRHLAPAEHAVRTRTLPRVLITGSHADTATSALHARALALLYPAILDAAGGTTVVDSSKSPTYLSRIQSLPGLDVRVVHLVRDPRAVAYAWTKDKQDRDQVGEVMMPKLHPAATACMWATWNLAIELICSRMSTPRLVVRYEDFVDEPMRHLKQISSWSGAKREPAIDLSLVKTAHTVSGNPDRPSSGAVDVKLDEAWKEELPQRHRRLVGVMTRPVARRFGY